MQGRTRPYRVRLIAYDALLVQHCYLTTHIPGPSPTPLAPLVPSELFAYPSPYMHQHPRLRKIRLMTNKGK